MSTINSTGRAVSSNPYTMISAKDKSRQPGDVIPCACGREGCSFVFDMSAGRREYRTDGCRVFAKEQRRRAKYQR